MMTHVLIELTVAGGWAESVVDVQEIPTSDSGVPKGPRALSAGFEVGEAGDVGNPLGSDELGRLSMIIRLERELGASSRPVVRGCPSRRVGPRSP
jgi:hypothetical protein